MQRYFVNAGSENDRYLIQGEDFHHITRVMRMKASDQIVCVTNDGKSAECIIEEITDEKVVAKVVKWEEGSTELPIKVSIASGLPKGDKLEWIIQKGTELGATEFVPFLAARSIVKWDDKKAEKKVDRWQKIAKEAAEQSYRNMVPNVISPLDLKTLLQKADDYDVKLIAYEEEAKLGEGAVLAKTLHELRLGQSLLVVFGPEGGLDTKEIAILKEHGFIACGLGPRILRTETAPLYLLSAVSYHLELLR
ncbi:16S rRNA (uracil(1498)-N(3))-methyltransferase [Bacillus sp. T3]|uniref:16S rRNA (uracil(1498)-N(3))-methyltransferase n=1 Tax=Bacillus sp. T3 TaxID=467262 RepID=UPI002980CD6E|nr:16S rRNA (uracil(1498)-N(3))-methyltransferase [Bacillus sp. T3]